MRQCVQTKQEDFLGLQQGYKEVVCHRLPSHEHCQMCLMEHSAKPEAPLLGIEPMSLGWWVVNQWATLADFSNCTFTSG